MLSNDSEWMWGFLETLFYKISKKFPASQVYAKVLTWKLVYKANVWNKALEQ